MTFQGTSQARIEVYWAIQDFGEERRGGLPVGFIAAVI
jgi:hypothetical protein